MKQLILIHNKYLAGEKDFTFNKTHKSLPPIFVFSFMPTKGNHITGKHEAEIKPRACHDVQLNASKYGLAPFGL